MIQYEKEWHGIYSEPEDVADYRLRLQQFFDHYLKGAQTPKWMMRSRVYKRNNSGDDFELMPAGVNP